MSPNSTIRGRERRAHDAAATRRALLDAAVALFDERGYETTTVREIGERAGVDPALIARYFDGKEGLYLASLAHADHAPLPPGLHAALGAMLDRAEAPGRSPVPRAMVSPSLTAPMRERLRAVIGDRVLAPLTAELADGGADDAALRAELLVALAMGVALVRESGTLPALAAASIPELLDVLAPAVEGLRGTD